MTNWEYGGHWRDLKMDGEIRLPHGSIVMARDWLHGLPEFMRQADTVFVDPPWNMSNVNTFYTKAGLSHQPGTFSDFSKELLGLIDEINPLYLFVEMGKEYLGWYLEQCRDRYRYVTFYNSTYYRKRENKCYVIHATNDSRRRRYKDLEDLDEAEIIAWLCANHEYHCIGDPCMGLGLVGWHAYLNGRRFVGTELNRKRLAVLVAKIKKAEEKKK